MSGYQTYLPPAGSTGTAQIADGAVTTPKLADGAVTEAKIDSVYRSMIDPLSTFPSYGTVYGAFDGHGCTDLLGSGSSSGPFVFGTSGTGAAINWGTAPLGRIGIISLDCGTTTTGVASLYAANTAVRFAAGRHRFRADVNIPTASDGTETFTVRVGFNDSASSGGDGTDGVFFRYAHSVNSGQWVCVCRANGSEAGSTTNTAVSAVPGANVFQALEIQVNASGTEALFYINGALVATITGNIPVGGGRETGISTHILKSAGTTARTLLVDLQGHRFDRSTPV